MSDEETRDPSPADGEGEPEATPEGTDTAADEASADDAAAPADEAAEAAAKAAAAKAKAEAAAKAKAAKEAAEAAKPPWQRDPATPEWDEADDAIAEGVREAHGEAIVWARTFAGDLVLMVERAALRDVARTLHDDHGFDLLLDICGADYGEREEAARFEVVVHLLNLDTARRVRLKVEVDDGESVPSLVPLWRGANWPERETWDMYGIAFDDHPDMTRILMWEGFNGHPLRKDFPVEGIDTGTAIYPEYYEETAGPVIGTGTGWKPPEEETAPDEATEEGAS